jgi:ribose 5-phosphate isomerase B
VQCIGIAADHGGFEMKTELSASLRAAGYELEDFDAHGFDTADDYPDFIIPLARAVAAAPVERGLALCGSGVGASVAANKVPGVRAGLIHDVFSAHQGVEDDDMNVLFSGGTVIGSGLALELIETFLHARFSGAVRHDRRLAKVHALENRNPQSMNNEPLSPECLRKINAYWRAANYLSVGQTYLYDNPLLKRPLKLSDVKPLVVSHWGTTPSQRHAIIKTLPDRDGR